MLYFFISLIVIASTVYFLGKYLNIKHPGSKKAEVIMNFLWTVVFLIVLIPCGIVAVASMNPYIIAVTFGVNILLGVWMGIFLKELHDLLN